MNHLKYKIAMILESRGSLHLDSSDDENGDQNEHES